MDTSCKCGQEKADVSFGRSRLLIIFITINLIAAALGVDKLATGKVSGVTYVLGRSQVVAISSSSFNSSGSFSGATATETFTVDYTSSNGCQTLVNFGFQSITLSDCKKIVDASEVWTAFGVLAVLTFFVLFLLICRIEFRQLVSQPMRLICIGLAFWGMLCTLIAFADLSSSPILKYFNAFGSSFALMVTATVVSFLYILLSFQELKKAKEEGAARAA